MFHYTDKLTLLGSVLAVENSKLSEDTHVSSLERQSSFQQGKDLIEESLALVELDDSSKFLCVHNNVETTDLRLIIDIRFVQRTLQSSVRHTNRNSCFSIHAAWTCFQTL